ncbi:hypothetical protein H5410_040124 [Solanum commersonii]|uniref:Tryptophan synthase beta chain-like PALP domain-containing protein n=1 Tax=Solanum commersonii TaxID=4109 RepID=A0A9J5XP68_SOLCO|nr:hypothetical protein H5410_040124 [Solanum commersonii]
MMISSFSTFAHYELFQVNLELLIELGQGTISLELLEQASEIDTLIVPISGGGLISGVALAAKAINPASHIFSAEPMGADDAFQSKINGRITKLSEVNTIADGLRAFLGDFTW